MDEETGGEKNPFQLITEGEPGNLTAVLLFDCPDCGARNRFTARDENAEGLVYCDCGLDIALEGDSLRGGQRTLDEINRSVKNLGDTFKSLSC